MNVETSRHFGFRVFLGLVRTAVLLGFCPSVAWPGQVTKDRTPANEFAEGYPRWRSTRLMNTVQLRSLRGATKERHTSDLIRICRARIVCIDLFRRCALVETDKALEEILAREIVVSTAGKVGEVVA